MPLQQTMSFTADTGGVTGPLQQMAQVMNQLKQTADSVGASMGRLTTTAAGFQAAVKGTPQEIAAFTQALRGQANIADIQVRNLQSLSAGTKNAGAAAAAAAREQAATARASAAASADAAGKVDAEAKRLAGSFDHVTLSWSGLLRLFQVQLLHQVFGALSNEFQQSITNAVVFQTKISEIQTISQSNQQSTQAWTQQLQNLSNEFGKPQIDVAQAAYETLSNQIAKGAESTQFLKTALDFAITTNSSATNSVNLLSSAINSYQLSSTDAERISAVFFKTIDLGRIKASELGNTFGRVAPLAAQLGVSLEETAAALATITRTGVPASEAITFLNNIFTALLKPTVEMQSVLQKFGVETGEQAIQTFTFAGVLHKLADEAKLGSTHMAELFQNIRGLKGINALTRELANFDRDLAALGEQANIEFKKAQELMKQTDAFKFTQIKQEISNFFTNEVGGQVVGGLVRLKNSIGDLREPLTVLVELVKAGVISFAAWRLTLTAVVGPITGLTNAYFNQKIAAAQLQQATATVVSEVTLLQQRQIALLSTVNLLASAFVAGVVIEQTAEAIIRATEQNRIRRDKTEQERQRTAFADNAKEFLANENLKTRGVIAALDQQKRVQLQSLTEGRRAAREAAKDTNEAYSETIDRLKISLASFLDTIREKIAAIKSSISTLSSIIRSARGDFEENLRGIGDSLFLGGAAPKDQISEAERKIDDIRIRIREITQRSLRDLPGADAEGLGFIKDDLALVRKLYDEINKLIAKEVQLSQTDSGASATSETLRKKFDAFTKAQADFDQFQARNVDKLFDPDQLLRKTQEHKNLLDKVKRAQQDLANETKTTSGLEASAVQRIIDLTIERLKLEQQVIDVAKNRRTELQKELRQQQEIIRQAAQDTTKLEKFSLLDPSGKVKEEFKADPQKAIQELKKLQDDIRQHFPEGLSVDLKFKIEQDLFKQLQLVKNQIADQVIKGNIDSSALVEGVVSFNKRIEVAAAVAKKNVDELGASLDNISIKLDSLKAVASSPSFGTELPIIDLLLKGAVNFNAVASAEGLGVAARDARIAYQGFAESVKKTVVELQNLKTQDLGSKAISDKIAKAEAEFKQAVAKLQESIKLSGLKPEDIVSTGTTQSVKSTINEITTEFKNLVIERDRALKAIEQKRKLEEGGKIQAGTNIGGKIEELTTNIEELKKKTESINFSDPGDVAGLNQILAKIVAINREFSSIVQKTQTPLDQILTTPQFDAVRDAQIKFRVLEQQLVERQQKQIQEGVKIPDVSGKVKELINQVDELKKKTESIDFNNLGDVAKLDQAKNKIAEINRELFDIVQKTKVPLNQIFTTAQFDAVKEAQLKFFELEQQLREKQQKQIQEGQRRLQQGAERGAAEVGSAVGLSIQTIDGFFSSANAQVEVLRANLISLNSIVISPRVAIGGSGGGDTQKFAHGGFVNMFRPRGFDVIPAMLRPGEIVMNAEVSGKFKSQLLALNAGKEPGRFSRGGEVTNVGGISVTVQGGDTSEQTLRSIGRGLNRQIRRGVLKLR